MFHIWRYLQDVEHVTDVEPEQENDRNSDELRLNSKTRSASTSNNSTHDGAEREVWVQRKDSQDHNGQPRR
jgi:hypothetical protein